MHTLQSNQKYITKKLRSRFLLPLILIILSLYFPQNSIAASTPGPINIWWPTQNSVVSGAQLLKAMEEGMDISEYSMYWQIGNGSWIPMHDSYNDYPHKEVNIDFTGWTWKGNEPYELNVFTTDKSGNLINGKKINIYTNMNQYMPPEVQKINPFKDKKIYVDPYSSAVSQANIWKYSASENAVLMTKLAQAPTAKWFGGWNSDIYGDVKNYVDRASAVSSVPILVTYNVPQRDCGSYSNGGAGSEEAYRRWIDSFTSAIGNRDTAVILEPDALAQITCLSSDDQNRRYGLLSYAVDKLKSNKNTSVYIDAGHSGWINENDMADRLKKSGINNADGFSLNTSNFINSKSNEDYGNKISALTNNKHFVIDTSRNGNDSNGEWCNPSGRAVGIPPQAVNTGSLIDAYLWVKTPGESDGNCNGGPNAGVWWPDNALNLIKNSKW